MEDRLFKGTGLLLSNHLYFLALVTVYKQCGFLVPAVSLSTSHQCEASPVLLPPPPPPRFPRCSRLRFSSGCASSILCNPWGGVVTKNTLGRLRGGRILEGETEFAAAGTGRCVGAAESVFLVLLVGSCSLPGWFMLSEGFQAGDVGMFSFRDVSLSKFLIKP